MATGVEEYALFGTRAGMAEIVQSQVRLRWRIPYVCCVECLTDKDTGLLNAHM